MKSAQMRCRKIPGRLCETASRAMVWAISLLLVSCPVVLAQKVRPAAGGDAGGELGERNLERVGASAEEIKAVLIEDPGLMIALKQWVAEDATNHGQIVSDADLTDAAIYERLETDVVFRGVATRILQRFGYLTPTVNPLSPIGQAEALFVQERMKLLAQGTQNSAGQARPQEARQPACGVQNSANCGGPEQRPQGVQPAPQMIEMPSAPGENPPEPASPPGSGLDLAELLGDESGPGSLGALDAGGVDESEALDGFSAALSPAAMHEEESSGTGAGAASLGSAASPGSMFGVGSSDSAKLSRVLGGMGGAGSLAGLGDLSSAFAQPDEALAALNQVDAQGFGSRSWNPGGAANQNADMTSLLRANSVARSSAATFEPTLLRQPDPYPGVPSLYDMYLQAVPRPASPRRFGEAVFENGTRDLQMLPMDLPVGPDYVVGPGDALAIDVWGGVSRRFFQTVDREGRISLPEAGPVLVSGKSLAEVQGDVQKLLRTQFRDISASVSLARLRTIRIYEVGEVQSAGAYDISSLSTPLNALFVAGGPTERGSMRIVKHYRGGQLVQTVDLYDLLLRGVSTGIARLENGDTVMVPPAGPEVTIEGMVRRPAIYELKDEKSLAEVIALAGGLLPAAALRHIEVQRLEAHEGRTMLSLDIPAGESGVEAEKKLASFAVQDGDRIRIFPIAPYNRGTVYLEGHVMRPGKYSYRKGMRVTDLIASYQDLLPEPASQYAEIIRLNPPDDRPSVESFDLALALADPSKAPQLEPLDTVRIFGRYDFQDPPSVSVLGDVRRPGTYRAAGEIRLADAVHLAGGLGADAEEQDAQVFRYLPGGQVEIFSVNLQQALDGDSEANVVLGPRDRLLVHRSPAAIQPATVYVEGEVGRPGRYPLASNMTVADLIRVGGGLQPGADPGEADLTRYQWAGGRELAVDHEPVSISSALAGDPKADAKLQDGDVLTIRQLANWNDVGSSIQLSGEVKHPGTYGIRPGERLSSVVERAGGFLPDAYPYGAILQRREVQEIETKERDQMVVRVKAEQGALTGLPASSAQQKMAKEAAMQQWQTALEELAGNPPVGRVTIRISKNIGRWRSTNADIPVQAGDRLTIPKRPSYVLVSGQVFNPTAISHRPGRSAKWYLNEVGGPTPLANRKAIFVIRADGTVIGSGRDLWLGGPLSAELQPGDTVVVPERSVPGMGVQWQNLFTTAQMASSVATAVIFALHY